MELDLWDSSLLDYQLQQLFPFMQNVCSLDIGSNAELSQNVLIQLMNLLCDNINGPKSMNSLCLSKIPLTNAIVDSMCSYL